MSKQLPKDLSSFILHFIKPYKLAASFYILIALIAGFWGPLNSIIVKQIIDTLPNIHSDNISSIYLPVALLVLNFIIFDNFTWRSIGLMDYKYLALIKNSIIKGTIDYTLQHSQQYFQNHQSGKISDQITKLADNIERILHSITPNFLRGTSLFIVSLCTAYYVNQIFFFIQLIWFVFFTTISFKMSKHLVKLADNHAKCESELSGQNVDLIMNQNNIRMFARKNYEMHRLKHFFTSTFKSSQARESYIVLLHSIQGGMIAIMMACSVFSLAYLYKQNAVTIGDFALIMGLSMELGHMMWYTMSIVDEFNEAVGKCRQSLTALIVRQEITDVDDAKTLKISKGQIDFENVKFHYKGTKALFNNKSVTIKAGEKVGLVGYSGSGKSTFVNLILRLYDISKGRILIDSQDISQVKQDSLREQIAIIPQEPAMFHRTIMENILYGKINAKAAEVIKAAKKAHADSFINNLPEKYQTLVGERGVKLSGGQRQRIAIARAFLKNAPILILDEATSQLDSITEGLIQESLWELMQGKTTIVVAHRLSTLLHMDRILVFDKGKIVQDGTHQQLIIKDGLYQTLWEAQIGGFLPEKK